MSGTRLMCFHGHPITSIAEHQPLKCPMCATLRRAQAAEEQRQREEEAQERDWDSLTQTLPDFMGD